MGIWSTRARAPPVDCHTYLDNHILWGQGKKSFYSQKEIRVLSKWYSSVWWRVRYGHTVYGFPNAQYIRKLCVNFLCTVAIVSYETRYQVGMWIWLHGYKRVGGMLCESTVRKTSLLLQLLQIRLTTCSRLLLDACWRRLPLWGGDHRSSPLDILPNVFLAFNTIKYQSCHWGFG